MTTQTKTAKTITVAEFAKRHKMTSKYVRRVLRTNGQKPGANGWSMTPARCKLVLGR